MTITGFLKGLYGLNNVDGMFEKTKKRIKEKNRIIKIREIKKENINNLKKTILRSWYDIAEKLNKKPLRFGLSDISIEEQMRELRHNREKRHREYRKNINNLNSFTEKIYASPLILSDIHNSFWVDFINSKQNPILICNLNLEIINCNNGFLDTFYSEEQKNLVKDVKYKFINLLNSTNTTIVKTSTKISIFGSDGINRWIVPEFIMGIKNTAYNPETKDEETISSNMYIVHINPIFNGGNKAKAFSIFISPFNDNYRNYIFNEENKKIVSEIIGKLD